MAIAAAVCARLASSPASMPGNEKLGSPAGTLPTIETPLACAPMACATTEKADDGEQRGGQFRDEAFGGQDRHDDADGKQRGRDVDVAQTLDGVDELVPRGSR